MVSVLRGRFGCLLVSGFLAACSGATWQEVDVESGYKAPKVMTVYVGARRGWEEATEVLTQALVEELSDHGIKAILVDDPSKDAFVVVRIDKWDPGSRGLRWVGFGMGEGKIFVTVDSSGVDGEAEGWVSRGWFGGSSDNSAEAVGELIGEALAIGEAAVEPEPEPRPAPQESFGY